LGREGGGDFPGALRHVAGRQFAKSLAREKKRIHAGKTISG